MNQEFSSKRLILYCVDDNHNAIIFKRRVDSAKKNIWKNYDKF